MRILLGLLTLVFLSCNNTKQTGYGYDCNEHRAELAILNARIDSLVFELNTNNKFSKTTVGLEKPKSKAKSRKAKTTQASSLYSS